MLRNFKTYRMALDFHHLAQTVILPAHLRDQLDRASSSIALNIAEGAGRATAKDQARCYTIALGSLRECEAILDLSGHREGSLASLLDQLGACLYVLSRPKTIK